MLCSVISDLHIEFHDICNLPPGDILILAGDIFVAAHMHKFHTDAISSSERKKYEKFCKEELSKFKHILYVKGNHEHYHGNFEDTSSILREYLSSHISNLTLLDNESIIIDGIKFIGSSLWGTYGCNTINHMFIQESMNDCLVIKTLLPIDDEFNYGKKGRNLNVFDIYKEHMKSCNFIENELKDTKLPCIIITHHAPSYLCLDIGNKLSDAYASNQHGLIEEYKPKLWIYGHTHNPMQIKINETLLMTNPRGYFGMEQIAKYFDPSACNFNLKDIK